MHVDDECKMYRGSGSSGILISGLIFFHDFLDDSVTHLAGTEVMVSPESDSPESSSLTVFSATSASGMWIYC